MPIDLAARKMRAAQQNLRAHHSGPLGVQRGIRLTRLIHRRGIDPDLRRGALSGRCRTALPSRRFRTKQHYAKKCKSYTANWHPTCSKARLLPQIEPAIYAAIYARLRARKGR